MDKLTPESISIMAERNTYTYADGTYADGSYSVWKVPTYSWKCQICPNTYWHIEDGNQPNRFHRFMQKVCFGVEWSKI
jgi:hypothetical protein